MPHSDVMAGTPVVFIHGLWLHADSWGAWVDRFRAAGYEPTAPGWPGDGATVEETRSNPERVAGHGIDDVVSTYARVIDGLDAKPIVIGHSFGGLIVQRLLGEDRAIAGVAIDAAPIKGIVYLPPSALRVASIALRNPANKKRAVALNGEAVPLRLRQRRVGGRVRGAVRALDDSVTGQAALRGRVGELRVALAGEGEHRERDARAAAPHRRRQGSHRPGGDLARDAEAVREVVRGDGAEGVPGPRPLALPRQRLERGRGRRPRLAEDAVALGRARRDRAVRRDAPRDRLGDAERVDEESHAVLER